MPLPRIAIVGRPNVGKSSLLNRLARRRVSIVDPTPGVTRDRVSTVISLDPPADADEDAEPRDVELIDTGGYGVYTSEGGRYDDVGADLADLTPGIEAQIRAARDQASLILFVTDAQTGLTPLDEQIARMLREEGSADRTIAVTNKVDSDAWVSHATEMSRLGFGEPWCISAASGYGMKHLIGELWNQAGASSAHEPPPVDEMRIAIVGKRNAGKSTLINALAGEERVIVSEIAGTTRDSIDVQFEIEGRTMIAIDTAGVRKRKSFADDVEYYAYNRMLKALRRADAALLLIDATEEVSQVDKKLASELQRLYKPTVIVVNKWDLVSDRRSPDDYLDYLTQQLRGLDFTPIVFISAARGEGLNDVVAMAFNLHQQASHREPTGRINQVVETILTQRGPSSKLGTKAKLYYATQIETNPPTIALVVNDPKLFAGGYERYLMNCLRDELPFSEVPIRLLFTPRTRASLDEVKRRGREKARAGRADRNDDLQ